MAKVASGQTMRSAERLLQVLKTFGKETPEKSIPEISRELDLAPSTVRRLLLTLEKEGFVRHDPAAGRYSLHYELIRLAAAALSGMSIVKVAAPVLDGLAGRLGEAVQLTVRDGADLVIVDNRQGDHLVKTFHRIGHRYPSYKGSAAGKAMLAWLDPSMLRSLLPASGRWHANTKAGIGALGRLEKELSQTREQGYAVNEAETEDGIWSVAAPVRDHTGAVIAALNVPCPVGRVTAKRKEEIIRHVVAAAATLSAAVPFAA